MALENQRIETCSRQRIRPKILGLPLVAKLNGEVNRAVPSKALEPGLGGRYIGSQLPWASADVAHSAKAMNYRLTIACFDRLVMPRLVTSISRIARCGPACRVMWEGRLAVLVALTQFVAKSVARRAVSASVMLTSPDRWPVRICIWRENAAWVNHYCGWRKREDEVNQRPHCARPDRPSKGCRRFRKTGCIQ